MRFRVLGHVETKKLYAERSRKPAGHLGLADARRPREEEGAHGTLGIAEPRTGDADRRNDSVDRLVLTEHGASNDLVERSELTVLALGNLLGRNAGHARDELGELLHADIDGRLIPRLPVHAGCAAKLIHQIERLVGEGPVRNPAIGQRHCPFRNLGRVMHAVVLLELRKHARHDAQSLISGDGRELHRLQTTREQIVLAEGLAPGTECGRRDEAQ